MVIVQFGQITLKRIASVQLITYNHILKVKMQRLKNMYNLQLPTMNR